MWNSEQVPVSEAEQHILASCLVSAKQVPFPEHMCFNFTISKKELDAKLEQRREERRQRTKYIGQSLIKDVVE
jgi:hypothetical protein